MKFILAQKLVRDATYAHDAHCNGNCHAAGLDSISNLDNLCKQKGENMYRKLIKNQKGIAVVETLLILVILIAIVLIFKEHLIELVTNIFDTILESAGEVY